jgi:hypothetical protein
MVRLMLGLMSALFSISAVCAPQTLRIDYFHSGNSQTEMFSLDQIVLEPLPFPGNLKQPFDLTARGKYMFVAIDPKTQKPLWSRSFSSIYGEWETIGEAKQMNRTFHESQRMPNQSKPFDFVIKKRDENNNFKEVWRIEIDPNDYLVHQESAIYASQVIAIENNGDSAEKVDLLILGDGYTAAQHESFVLRATQLSEELLSTPPFKQRRSDFNVWAIAPASAMTGVSRPSTNNYVDSPLGVSFDAFRSERYVLTSENKSMRRIASSAPYDFVQILTNTETYGGGGIYRLYATTSANSEWSSYVFIHEFGHHFAGLADEYYTSSVSYQSPQVLKEPYEPNVTINTDRNTLKWRDLVDQSTPLPTPWPKEAYDKHSYASQEVRAQMRKDKVAEAQMNALFRSGQTTVEQLFSKAKFRDSIGLFEGANYQPEGTYRSQQNCMMFTRSNHFCKVCANAIEQVIDEYTQAASDTENPIK